MPNILAFVWSLGTLTVAIKASRGACDRWPVHMSALMLLGWSFFAVRAEIEAALSPSATRLIVIGGACMMLGLVPWALLRHVEYHIVYWHVCVLAGCVCYWLMVYDEILGADDHVQCAAL